MNYLKLSLASLAIVFLASFIGHAEDAMISGEVKKIDQSAKKITLKHGPIKTLGMEESMTMVFRVADPSMLRQVKAGDKVKFMAERGSDGFAITKIQKSN